MSIKVLSIGSDRNLFKEGSAVSERIKEYGALVEELHIVVFTLKSMRLTSKQLAPNVWVYPTNSSYKIFYPHDAAQLGGKIVLKNKFVRGESLVTTQDPFESGWAGLKIKTRWRIPLQVQMHTDPFSKYFRGFLNMIRKRIAKKILKKADNVRVVTEYLEARVRRITKAPINVLPIYIDRQRIEEGKANFDVHNRYPWAYVILMVSRLETEKNIPLAFKILSQVREHFGDTGLIIVGSGSEETKLKSLAKKMELDEAVEFAGWHDDLTSFYKTSNVFLQTSSYEGYGLSLIEAGLLELPVVTTPVGIAGELEHETDAYIYPASNPKLFADAISDLFQDESIRERLKLNLKKKLECKLLSKKDYLDKLVGEWARTAKLIS